MDRVTLLQRIRDEFARTTRGVGRTLHEAIGLDKWLNGDDLNRERARDTDVRWGDVPDEVIEGSPEIFSFLDFRGFAYYLPAYMAWSVQHYDHSESGTPNFLIYALDPSGLLASKGFLDQLSPGQKAVTAEFLAFMSKQVDHADSDAADRALQGFWNRYLPSGEANEG